MEARNPEYMTLVKGLFERAAFVSEPTPGRAWKPSSRSVTRGLPVGERWWSEKSKVYGSGGRGRREMNKFDDEFYPCPACSGLAGEMRSNGLYRVVIPRQNVVVRLNGVWPDTPENEFLPAVRPYGILRMAWAIWREVPGVAPKEALSFALRVRRKDEAEVLVASGFLAEHVRLSLLARHHLVARVENAC